jgi:hypothetical protein
MAPFNAGCDGRRRFWPAPNRIEDAPVGWVTVANMHARLIVNGPRDLRIFCAQAGFDRQVSGHTCIAWVAVDNVDVAARDRVSGKAMKMVPNGVAYETGANPAIVDAEFFHGCKQHYNVPLSFKELGDVVESLHAGQATQSPTHSVVRNGSFFPRRGYDRFRANPDLRSQGQGEFVPILLQKSVKLATHH